MDTRTRAYSTNNRRSRRRKEQGRIRRRDNLKRKALPWPAHRPRRAPALATGNDTRYRQPVTPRQVEALIAAVRFWVEGEDDLRALALAGSWARGDARPNSDVDLLIVANEPAARRCPEEWLPDISFAAAGFEIDDCEARTYGDVWSCHVSLHSDGEVELTFAPPAWASASSLDPGTTFVVRDAFRVIVDKDGALQRLIAAVRAHGAPNTGV